MRQLGVLERRTPVTSWASLRLADFLRPGIPATPNEFCDWRRIHSPAFLFDTLPSPDLLNGLGSTSVSQANEIAQGNFPTFGYTTHCGYPPRWTLNPSDCSLELAHHWSRVDEFAFGDIKLCWELSRFTWAYTLARAYARTADDGYSRVFWELVENWMQQNQPNSGANWKCGQEASFRIMAICFAARIFRDSPESTPERMARLIILVAMLGRRIAAYIEYAQSQKNNHGISEGAGLWTIALVFPELKESEGWRARGKIVIESEVRRQIYHDGSYVQHSTNYHRVMLHDLAWSIRLGEANKDRLALDVYERFAKAVRFLYTIVDPDSGSAPNCGANDGALVFPLTDCAFPDMRPVLQSCNYIVEKKRLYEHGSWDEESVWMNGLGKHTWVEATRAATHMTDVSAYVGGYYTIRSMSSWGMLRAAKYKDRPSHADQLHFDLWWRGDNVLCDPGTYSYNAPAPFQHALASTRFHSTVIVDSADQMSRTSRFLWTDWANAQVARSGPSSPEMVLLQGVHDGYAKIDVLHRRAVLQPMPDVWIVVDDLTGSGTHTAQIHWLAADAPIESISPTSLKLKFRSGVLRLAQFATEPLTIDLVRSGERIAGTSTEPADPCRGWISRRYRELSPALSLTAVCSATLPIRFVTVVLLEIADEVDVSQLCTTLAIGRTTITLTTPGQFPIDARLS